LRRGENRSTLRKTSWSKEENQQQTQPRYGVDAGIRTWATLVGGECSHHCATLIANLHTGCAINVHVLFMLHNIATTCVCPSNGSRGLAVAEMRPKIKECGSQRYFFQDREAYRDKLILGHDRRLQGNLTSSELCSVNKLWGQKGLNIESVVHVRQSPPVYSVQDIHCQLIIFTSVKSTV